MKNTSVVLSEVKQLLELKYSGVTPQNYLSHIGRFLMFCDNAPLRVNNEDILNYNIHIRHKSNSYRNVAINAIKAYFKLYLRKQVKGFSSIRPPKENKVPRYMSLDYFNERMKKVDNNKHRVIFYLGYGLGLRSNETRSILLKDINIEQGSILIRGKGSKQRYLKLDAFMINLIVGYVDEYYPKVFLIEGQKGKYSQSSINNLMSRYFGDYTYHNFRHSFARYVYLKTGNIKLVSDKLGHSNVKTTEQFYIHYQINESIECTPVFA